MSKNNDKTQVITNIICRMMFFTYFCAPELRKVMLQMQKLNHLE